MAYESATGTKTGIQPLTELGDYRVAGGHPDIRGWNVFDAEGTNIGTVRDLLVDLDAMKARYMIVGLKHGFFSRERKVAIPVGRARLDDADDRVLLDDVNASRLDTLHEYDASTFRTQERALFGGDYTSRDYDDSRLWGARGGTDAGDRRVVLHEEQLDVGKRQVPAGEVVVNKQVTTERARQTVPLTREEVTVERRPVTGDRAESGDVTIEGEEIRIPLMAEEADIQKRKVATEEVVVRKHVVTENREVEADLEREEVFVDESGVKKKEPV